MYMYMYMCILVHTHYVCKYICRVVLRSIRANGGREDGSIVVALYIHTYIRRQVGRR